MEAPPVILAKRTIASLITNLSIGSTSHVQKRVKHVEPLW